LKDTTIVYAHPYDQSFNHAILEKVTESLKNQPYAVFDLYEDKFNPVYSKEELKYFAQGKALDPLVESYQKQLKKTKHLVLIFPIWWYDMPAILKGFFDKVMLNQFSYVDTKTGIEGRLTHIEKVTVITTSKAPTWYLKYFGGNAIEKVLIKSTLKGVGIGKSEWLNLDKMTTSTPEKRQSFLDSLSKKFE
jgi:putative NADPH-quinone reductase